MERSLGEHLNEVRSGKIVRGRGPEGFRQAYIEALFRFIMALGGDDERVEVALPMTLEASLEMSKDRESAQVVLRFFYAPVSPDGLTAQTRAVVRKALKEYGGGLQEQQEPWQVGSPPWMDLEEEIRHIEEALEEVRP